MSLGPKLFPIACDMDDGSFRIVHAAGFVDYDPQTLTVDRIKVYDNTRTLVLDEVVTRVVEGKTPTLVADRHQFTLADGRVLYVLVERGCGCGSTLKSWTPGWPATSGRRP